MSSRFRSSSLGAVPHKKPLSRSRAQSSQAAPLEVRCACQFFQSDSLIPERINPIGSRPASRAGEVERPIYCSKHPAIESTLEEEELSGSLLSFGKASGPDYYGDTNNVYRIDANDESYSYSIEKENESQLNQPLRFENQRQPSEQPLRFDSRQRLPSEQALNINYPQSPTNQPLAFDSQRFPSEQNFDSRQLSNQPLTFDGRRRPSEPPISFERRIPEQPLSFDRRRFPSEQPAAFGSRQEESNLNSLLDRNSLSNQPLTLGSRQDQPLPFVNQLASNQPLANRSIPSIEIEQYTRSYQITSLSQNSRTLPNSPPNQFSSQKSLDRYSTSTLLNRYRPKSQSVAPSLQGSAVDIRAAARMTKTVSFDYGKPSGSGTQPPNENPNFDQYHCMSPMVFPIRDRLQRLERMHDSR